MNPRKPAGSSSAASRHREFQQRLKRGSLEVTKTSEDGLVEGMTFHLYGTSLSGQPVDEYAVTDSSVARFENVLIGSGYVLEEVCDTPFRQLPSSGMKLPTRA